MGDRCAGLVGRKLGAFTLRDVTCVWVFVEESPCPFSVRIQFPRQNQAAVTHTGHQNHSGITVPCRKNLLRPCREASKLGLPDASKSRGEFLVDLPREQPAFVRQAPFPEFTLLTNDAYAEGD
jgi:hypothetical protein